MGLHGSMPYILYPPVDVSDYSYFELLTTIIKIKYNDSK
jgi:hypothetical protein